MVLLLCALLVLVSYLDRLYTETGKFLSREFQENIEAFEKLVEPRLLRASRRASLAFAVLAQLVNATIAFLIGYLVFRDTRWTWPEIVQAIIGIILVIILCNRLLPYVLFTRTRGAWLVHFVPLLLGLIYLMLPITVALGFGLSVAALAEPHEPEESEHPSEAVDALIEAAEEEGILHESDRQLIQSVVEFGDKTVREVMTPRPNIFAVPGLQPPSRPLPPSCAISLIPACPFTPAALITSWAWCWRTISSSFLTIRRAPPPWPGWCGRCCLFLKPR